MHALANRIGKAALAVLLVALYMWVVEGDRSFQRSSMRFTRLLVKCEKTHTRTHARTRRVLELVGEGGAPLGAAIDGADTLYEAAAAVPWSRFMRQGQTLSVDAILGVVPDGLTHSHFTALTVKVRRLLR